MTLTCLCSHTAADHPGGECVHRSCGCLEFRLDPRSRLRDEPGEAEDAATAEGAA